MHREPAADGPRVLIVDDHPISRQFMAAALRRVAADVKQACTADEARTLAWTWLPDVILMDVRLAEANGFEVARQIRERWPRATRQPRVIMLSAGTREAAQCRSNPAGTDRLLAKPVTVPVLLDAVAASTRPAPGCVDEHSLAQLQDLFRSELAARLLQLEECLTAFDLAGAQAILHQLIASSGLCQQRRLERDLRALYEACGKHPEAASLAGQYFSLLVSAGKYLQPPSFAQRN